ncbi:hypothetical protein A4G99_19085 [Haladaptatus sp. R4]|uniref:hypothetical protein n=1 Tax=Haladaptatus sp. R4 TaxID=1679489 RepID=UPI0007B47C39|nr:hypothetical protein A4G99_19085 [Haladaptatus sp. R4]
MPIGSLPFWLETSDSLSSGGFGRVLWATFCLLLALERDEYTEPVATFTALVGAATALVGYLMAAGFWPWA